MALLDAVFGSSSNKKNTSNLGNNIAKGYSYLTNPVGTAVKSATGGLANSVATGLANYGNPSNNQQNYQKPLYPEMPKSNLTYNTPQMMEWQQAMDIARQRLEPGYKSSQNEVRTNFATEKEKLPQQLNARGQLFGGLREGGENQLTQQQAMALEQLNLDYQSRLSDLAADIQGADYAHAKSLADSQYQAQKDISDRSLAAWQADVSRIWQENQAQQNWQLAMMDALERQKAAETAANQWNKSFEREGQQWDKSYGLQEAGLTGLYNGMPTLTNQQYQNSIENQPWYSDLYKKQMEADIANTLRSANAPYGGSGGGGSLSPYQNSQLTKYYNTQDFIANLLSFEDPRQARSFLQNNSGAAAANGADISSAMRAMASKWPEYFKSQEDTGLPSVYDYWYPMEE